MNLPHDLLTAKEAATLLRIDVDTAKEWFRGGRVKAFKYPGGKWMVLRSEVEAFLEKGAHAR